MKNIDIHVFRNTIKSDSATDYRGSQVKPSNWVFSWKSKYREKRIPIEQVLGLFAQYKQSAPTHHPQKRHTINSINWQPKWVVKPNWIESQNAIQKNLSNSNLPEWLRGRVCQSRSGRRQVHHPRRVIPPLCPRTRPHPNRLEMKKHLLWLSCKEIIVGC